MSVSIAVSAQGGREGWGERENNVSLSHYRNGRCGGSERGH